MKPCSTERLEPISTKSFLLSPKINTATMTGHGATPYPTSWRRAALRRALLFCGVIDGDDASPIGLYYEGD